MPGMVWVALALVAVGLVIGLPATAAARAVGRRRGAFDSPGAAGHVKQLRQVPNNGGIAILLAVAAPVAAGIAAVWLVDAEAWSRWLPAMTADHMARIKASTPVALAMILGMVVLFITGSIDDRRSLSPWVKLGIELAVAAVMVGWFEIRLLTMLGFWPSVIITVIWIVVVTNAINFMDNMDGLAAGVSAIAAAIFMVACVLNRQWFIAATLALLIGGLVGFLVFNFPPASIFMGDRGALVIGFLLAILTVRTTYYTGEPGYPLGGGWYAGFMPLLVLAIPLYDFASVVLIRLRQGRSPFVGDQQHFSHRMVQRGLSPRGAVVVIWAATAVTGIGGISLGRLEGWQAILVGVQAALVLLMIALVEHASRRSALRDAGS